MSVKIPLRLRSVSFLMIILSVVFLGFANHNSIVSDENIIHTKNNVPSSYSDYSPIIISNDSDFLNQGWMGNGTEEDPFRIEGLSITSDSVGIDVANSSVFFEIKNCIFSSLTRWEGIGVQFSDVENGRVIDCQFDNLHEGIVFDSVSNCEILNSELHWNHFHGVRIQSSVYCVLENNTCSDNFYSGFH
ncbi:MAG: NosD domain-containing protein, partial [Candidatus Thorarchaeota archaeon]